MKKSTGLILGTAAALALAKGLDNRLEITHYCLQKRRLPPEFDGFKILHISDFHSETVPLPLELLSAEEPDIIAVTGDMVNDTGDCSAFLRTLKGLVKIAPVYIVSGNHDIWRPDFSEMVRAYTDAGAVFLRDEREIITRDGAKISISGIDDPFAADFRSVRRSIEESLSKLGGFDGFELLLFHRANLLDLLKSKGFDLILAGHLHGGQIRIPGIGGVLSPKSSLGENSFMLFPKYFGGSYCYADTTMIVSRGIGNPTFLPRLFNRPELCVIELRAAAE